jgi:hypothetical protein
MYAAIRAVPILAGRSDRHAVTYASRPGLERCRNYQAANAALPRPIDVLQIASPRDPGLVGRAPRRSGRLTSGDRGLQPEMDPCPHG